MAVSLAVQLVAQVLERSGQEQVTYIGHSMGTTSFWVMMNMRPWMNEKVRQATCRAQGCNLLSDPPDVRAGPSGRGAEHVLPPEVPHPGGHGGEGGAGAARGRSRSRSGEGQPGLQVEKVLSLTGQ